jgi:threonine synthase
MGEGGTPLLHAPNLGMMLGNKNIFIKDERQGPTASFKDRQAVVSIACLKEAGIVDFVCASTGNVAISYSAYAARAGINLWAFLTSLVPASKMREVSLYGTQVIKVTGSYDEAKRIADKFSKDRGITLDLGSRSVACVEAMKTVAYEICEQLGLSQSAGPVSAFSPSPDNWKAPDWYIQSVSGGLGPLGVVKGFSEFLQMGFIKKIPKIGIIQAEGCAPMVHAWHQQRDSAIPVNSPRTLIATLATGDPGRTYTELYKKIKFQTGGTFESVSDEEAYRAVHILAKLEGISVEPAAAVAFAGLFKMIRSGLIKPDETVVINCTGHTQPIDRNILGEGWNRTIDLKTALPEELHEEGLLAALREVSIDRFPKVAIIDDEPEVRRLIRRILQSQANYTLFEAADGKAGLALIKKEKPNLVILDLMMPEMDGFSVMNALQQDQSVKDIPIIVVTAKELTTLEKTNLRGHIKALMQKGDFMSDDFLDEITANIK